MSILESLLKVGLSTLLYKIISITIIINIINYKNNCHKNNYYKNNYHKNNYYKNNFHTKKIVLKIIYKVQTKIKECSSLQCRKSLLLV